MLDALKLMRIPFSLFLMPVYWFALVQLNSINVLKAILIFFIIHVLVYPASNGYNSFFDKDEGSIGGLKNPPKVNRFLFPTVLIFDVAAILMSLILSLKFAMLILVYTLVSKAYSYDKIRLKKYPLISTLVVITFQGFFMFLTVQEGLGSKSVFDSENLILALCSSIFLLGSYPLTQVYQHKEDAERGDKTLSLLLGIKGTFVFSSVAFLLGTVIMGWTLVQQNNVNDFFFFLILGLPILMYFGFWFRKVLNDEKEADFEQTMKMNIISSLSLSAAFMLMLLF